ncbi:hypothetical protein RRG08_005702 [Elysia crispata]|uniref:Uncharacterized protein n=1 Tax=Elysia crispata TaxID=231223 RepID=A0AAE0YCN5_9GAST|nr:hypothetical protein RRG08_005702 [Elysia crispata]
MVYLAREPAFPVWESQRDLEDFHFLHRYCCSENSKSTAKDPRLTLNKLTSTDSTGKYETGEGDNLLSFDWIRCYVPSVQPSGRTGQTFSSQEIYHR